MPDLTTNVSFQLWADNEAPWEQRTDWEKLDDIFSGVTDVPVFDGSATITALATGSLDITDAGKGSTTQLVGVTGADGFVGELKSQPTDGVSTSATDILDFNGSLRSSLITVQGDERNDNDRFADVVHTGPTSEITVVDTNTANAPDGRTYTYSGNSLRLAMSANTYDVIATGMITQRDAN